MPRRLRVAIALPVLLPSLVAAAKPPEPSPYIVSPPEPPPLVNLAGIGQFDARSGAARMLSAPGFRGDAADPAATARAYLAFDAARLGLPGPPDESALPVRAIGRGRAATVVRFEQRLAGLPVYDAEIAVAVTASGDVSYVASTHRAGLGATHAPFRIDGAEALDAALGHLGGGAARTLDSERMVYASPEGARPVWRLLLAPEGEPRGEWEILIDAELGTVLLARDQVLYGSADGSASVFDPDPLSSAQALYPASCDDPPVPYCDNGDADHAVLTAELFTVTLPEVTENAGVYSLVGPYAACVDVEAPFDGCPTSVNGTWNFQRAAGSFEAANGYHHIDALMRYLNETLGTPVSPFQYAGGARYDPHGLNGEDNSHYVPSTGLVAFGEGGVDDAEDADVLIHELGHAIHHWVTSGGLSQAQGLSEGVGDYFAASYSRAYTDQWTPADPQYDWVFSWDGHNEFWGGRVTDYDETHTYPINPAPGIHTYGQMWSSCSLNAWDRIGRDAMDAAMVEGLRMTGAATNQAAAAQAVLNAAWNMSYSISEVQILRIEYSSGGCLYNPSHPADPDRIAFDGFEYGDTSEWDVACPPDC